MTSFFYFLLVLFIQFSTHQSFASELNLDSIRMQKMIEKDTIVLSEMVDDSLLYIHSNGLKESKIDFINHIVKGKIIYDSFLFLSRQEDAGLGKKIYRGEVIVIGKYEDTPFKVKLAYISIYISKENQYKLLYWQSTKLPI